MTAATGWTQKSIERYMIGLLLCVALTISSFALVQYNLVSNRIIYMLLSLFVVMQVCVQCYYFLGFNTDKQGKWNLLPFLFTLLIIVFLLGGSLWIMFNLANNMAI